MENENKEPKMINEDRNENVNPNIDEGKTKKKAKHGMLERCVLIITICIVLITIMLFISFNEIGIFPGESIFSEFSRRHTQSYYTPEYDEDGDPIPHPDKPIIYLYPQKDEIVNVKLGHPDEITASYPKYTTGWSVLAKPNGDLTYLGDGSNKNSSVGRKLYSLYYESQSKKTVNFENDGFVVKGSDTTAFLENKLAKLGLSEREAEEFIVYWLPILQNNKYNFIHFATSEEVSKVMPLSITTKDGRMPDTTIRVLMCYKPLNAPISVPEQKIVTPQRKGFVAVEWGGTKLNGNLIR